MRIVIYDFEVFKHDTLLGAIILEDGKLDVIQTWDLHEIQDVYHDNVNSIWVGHNIERYDNLILQCVVNGGTEEQIKQLNDNIIHDDKRVYLRMPLIYYDLIKAHFCALKVLEAYAGKNISESDVDFNLDRKLTDEEKRKTESYNFDDLEQTMDDFIQLESEFLLRLDVIKEFNLSIKCLSITGTQLAEEVLHAEKIHGIDTWVKLPTIWPNLQVKRQSVINFYMNRDYASQDASKRRLVETFCGTQHTIAAGGIHAAKRKYHAKWAYYLDVSGYYNLIMINLNLLPRSIPQQYQHQYEDMYHTQLELKKTNPGKRGVYKTILLSVFGAMNNEGCRFYDPYNGDLVRLSGQLFLVDLLEKLEGHAEVVQSNTDGIILEPLNGATDDDIKRIVDEWQDRTGFVLKFDKIYDIHQRDVNCYMYKTSKGDIETLGEGIKDYGKMDYPFWKNSYDSKDALIICLCVVDYFMKGILPEETVEKNRRNLKLFQHICKKLSYDYMQYEQLDITTNQKSITQLQTVNRAFALKSSQFSGMVYKYKMTDGKKKSSKIPNLPDSVFVYNDEILSDAVVQSLSDKIDYQHYIKRAYEKILTFYDMPMAKELTL